MAQRILLLGDISSSHIEKWAAALAEQGYEIGIFSLNKGRHPWYLDKPSITVLYEGEKIIRSEFIFNKLKYILALPKLLECIKIFNPDIVHAHYASSYGLLGALSGAQPFVISVWGSDVYEFPRKSFIHKLILKFNLKKASKIFSTSYAMKGELWKYTHKEIEVISFGVDTQVFYPQLSKPEAEKNQINIGTIKAMEDKYGIPVIIEAVSLVKERMPETPFKLYLIGNDLKTKKYKKIVESKQLADQVEFTGKIAFSEIPYYHNLLDIFLNVSIVDESFGVSVVESMACEKAVIVSNAPGLAEVVDKYGFIVEKGNASQLAETIIQLIESPQLRLQMGKNARKHVLNTYDFKNSLALMTKAYDSAISGEIIFSEEKFEINQEV